MKRLLAVVLFVCGGFSFELSNPVNCSLIHACRPFERRRKG